MFSAWMKLKCIVLSQSTQKGFLHNGKQGRQCKSFFTNLFNLILKINRCQRKIVNNRTLCLKYFYIHKRYKVLLQIQKYFPSLSEENTFQQNRYIFSFWKKDNRTFYLFLLFYVWFFSTWRYNGWSKRNMKRNGMKLMFSVWMKSLTSNWNIKVFG